MWNLKTSSRLLKELELQRNFDIHQKNLKSICSKKKFPKLNSKKRSANFNNKYDRLKNQEIHEENMKILKVIKQINSKKKSSKK